MAAIHGKFATIMKSGIFVIKSEAPDRDALAEVTFSLQYSRSTQPNDNKETMPEKNIKDFVQHLGFINRDLKSTGDSDVFIRMYTQLSQIRDIQHSLITVGYKPVNENTMEYAIASPDSPAEIDGMLNALHKKQEQCNKWLKEVRSKHKYSLLFHMDELLCIYKYLSKSRKAANKECELRGSGYLDKILEAISRLSLEVSKRPKCLELIVEYVLNSSSDRMSWYEDGKNCAFIFIGPNYHLLSLSQTNFF